LHFLEAAARWFSIVVHRAELIERMKHEAVEQGRRLAAEELLTVLAHDLRNYLTPLKWRVDMLALRAQRDEREQDVRDITSLNHTLGLLERVIADLLDVAGLNQGIFAVTPRPMNLVELIQEVAQAFDAPEKPVQVHGPAKVILSADADRLRQLLENVLANAVKYAPKQTPIRVELRVEQRMDGQWVVLTVSNAGPGLPPALLTTIFHPFVAGSQSTGLGLGLYLANRIAVAHDGTLTIDSEVDQGVQVTLALPAEDEELIVEDK
jgi:two-component system, OmpR family, sensor kinase